MKESSPINRLGQSLIEVLIGIVLLGVITYSVPQLSQIIARQSFQTKLASMLLTIESEMISALLDPTSFYLNSQGKDYRQQMESGISPTGLDVQLSPPGSSQTRVVKVGVPTYVNVNGDICTTPGVGVCAIKVEMDIQCQKPPGSNASCNAAYRISVLSEALKINSMASLGAPGVGAFTNADYAFAINPDFFIKANENKDSIATCNPETHIGASGINRDTGEIYCLAKPQSPMNDCPPNTVAKRFEITSSGGSAGQVKFVCVPLKKSKCDDGYIQSSLDMTSFDPESTAKVGDCSFVTRDSEPWNKTLSGINYIRWELVCPRNYVADRATCTIKNQSTAPFTCRQCACNCKSTATGTTCDTCGGEQVQPPQYQSCSPQLQGQYASAVLDPVPPVKCACGGSADYSVEMEMTGFCQLQAPGQKPAQLIDGGT